MTVVVDASVVGAALTGRGAAGDWATDLMAAGSLVGPHLLPVEVANQLRRAVLTGRLATAQAAHAHAELLASPVRLFPYQPFAVRVWELRDNVTAYDAWYVALAEQLEAPLATLDRRLVAATGPTCEFLTLS